MLEATADRPALPPLKRGSHIRGRFVPLRRDDLKPSILAYEGRSGVFETLWKIEDGPYKGDWALRIPKDWPVSDAFWVPERALFLKS
jgi:hypothetical protein